MRSGVSIYLPTLSTLPTDDVHHTGKHYFLHCPHRSTIDTNTISNCIYSCAGRNLQPSAQYCNDVSGKLVGTQALRHYMQTYQSLSYLKLFIDEAHYLYYTARASPWCVLPSKITGTGGWCFTFAASISQMKGIYVRRYDSSVNLANPSSNKNTFLKKKPSTCSASRGKTVLSVVQLQVSL